MFFSLWQPHLRFFPSIKHKNPPLADASRDKLEFGAVIKTHVIPSQCAHWRGNPLQVSGTFDGRNRHISRICATFSLLKVVAPPQGIATSPPFRRLLAMTCGFGTAPLNYNLSTHTKRRTLSCPPLGFDYCRPALEFSTRALYRNSTSWLVKRR